MIKAIKRQFAYKKLYKELCMEGAAIGDAWQLTEIAGQKEASAHLARQIVSIGKKTDSLRSKMWWIMK